MINLSLFRRRGASKVNIDNATKVNKQLRGKEHKVSKIKDDNWRDEEHCKNLCIQASMACLQSLHGHVIEYLDRNIKNLYRAHHMIQDLRDDTEECATYRSCSYENFMREFYPENFSAGDIDKNEVDFRFYLHDSDHRIIWNTYVDAFGCSELTVNAERGVMRKLHTR